MRNASVSRHGQRPVIYDGYVVYVAVRFSSVLVLSFWLFTLSEQTWDLLSCTLLVRESWQNGNDNNSVTSPAGYILSSATLIDSLLCVMCIDRFGFDYHVVTI